MKRIWIFLFVGALASVGTPKVAKANELNGVKQLYQEKEKLDQTVWRQEVEAQEHEEYFVRLWDALRRGKHEVDTFEAFDFGELSISSLERTVEVENDIVEYRSAGAPLRLSHEAWMNYAKNYREKGYRLIESEWHHGVFERPSETAGARSTVSFTLHIAHDNRPDRLILKGKLKVDWKGQQNEEGVYEPAKIDATAVTGLRREAEPGFVEMAMLEIPPRKAGVVLVNDLNRDGLPDLVVPNINTVLWNLGEGSFGGKPMHAGGVTVANTGIIGDFTGDGYPDVIIEGSVDLGEQNREGDRGLYLFTGSVSGEFKAPVKRIEIAGDLELAGGPCFTSGDIDGDGDLDLWLGQYKEMYLNGTMPDPYYDANDGYLSYLLINDGDGSRFVEETEKRGIAEKRTRRVFSSSFYDYDYDGDLDLLVVADFAGLDLYENDGSGTFVDVTEEAFDNRHLFGMAHSIADFNADGHLDLYSIGMSSTTARRLEAMDAGRSDQPMHNQMRMEMGYGNRLYTGSKDGTLVQRAGSDQYARSGWSWGVGSFDLENDGDLETYIANGHFSNESARDYCSRFWTDDIYRGNKEYDPTLETYFAESVLDMISDGMSWNGFEHNVLFSQCDDGVVRNIGFLMGVASELDSRQVIVEDFDADGRMDLMFTTYPTNFRKKSDPTHLRILRNVMGDTGNWIGVRTACLPNRTNPEGARIVVTANGRKRAGVIVNGDSHQSQHSTIKHFGLGDAESVEAIDVYWPGGEHQRIENPSINTYHAVLPKIRKQ